MINKVCDPCADPESFVRGGPKFDNHFFLVDEGREDPSTTINRPSSASQLISIKWWFASLPMTAQH